MKSLPSITSACRRCRYYEPEGRRGGHCQQLNVAVQGDWTACALAIPPFSPAWESFEDIMVWQQKTLAAMQASAESAMTDVLSEAAKAEAIRTEAGNTYEDAVVSSAGEATESRLQGASLSQIAQPLPTAPVRTVGLKALWM